MEELAKMRAELETLKEGIESDVEMINVSIQDSLEKIGDKVSTYNEKLEEMRAKVEEIATELRGRYDDTSEQWQESERGQSVNEMIGQWEELDQDIVQIDEMETLELSVEVPDLPDLDSLPTDSST